MIQAGKPQSIKVHNTFLIRMLIVKNGPLTKPEIAHISNLSLPTVNRIVDELVESSFASETQTVAAQRSGRPAKAYIANKNYGAYVGIYYQDRKWVAVRANFLGEVEEKRTFPAVDHKNVSQDQKSPGKSEAKGRDSQQKKLMHAIRSVIGKKDNVKVIALGIPGVVRQDGIITGIPQLTELENIHLESVLREEFHLPVIIENDVKLKTIGYHSECLRELDSIVFLYIGSGIGAGLILNGQLYKGMSNFAGEFGFMPDGSGEMENTLLPLRENVKKDPDDKKAREMLEDKLSRMLRSVISVINPQAVVIDCKELNGESLRRMKNKIGNMLPAGCLPELYSAEGLSYEEKGLIQLCGDYYKNHTEEWLTI